MVLADISLGHESKHHILPTEKQEGVAAAASLTKDAGSSKP